MSGKEKGWRYNPFSGLTFALSAAFRTCSLALSLPLPLVLYICVCILFLMFCFLTLAVICSACVCVCVRACASSSLSALPGIVYNTTQRRVYIFVFCVFFTCSSRLTCYPVRLSQNVLFCLPASTSASTSALASACLGLLVVITRVICVSFPPSGRPAKKQNDVLWRHVTCVIYVTPTPCCRSWWLLFFFLPVMFCKLRKNGF